MAPLTAAQRKRIPKSKFAVKSATGKDKYPVDTRERAKAALGLVGMHGTPEQKAEVRAKVKSEFPDIQQKAGKSSHRARAMKHSPHKAIGSHDGYTHKSLRS